MFCSHCGKEIAGDALICVGCSRPVKAIRATGEKWGTRAMIGLIIGSMVIPNIGIIVGIIGLTKQGTRRQGAQLLAIGIIMTVAWIVFCILS